MITITTYNCNSIKNNFENVQTLTQEYDIILLQELMLLKEDIAIMKTINESFDCVSCVQDKSYDGILEGRPSRGVAIIWRKNLAKIITPVYCSDRIIGIVLT